MSFELRVGLIGAGNRGRGLIHFLNLLDEFRLVAVADMVGANLEEANKISHDKPRITANHEDLLDMEDIDAVIIATPNDLHADISIAALEAGKHVYCEKPLATTVADCDRIIATAEKSGKTLMVGLQLRYSDLYQKLKAIISRGDIGQVRMVWCKEFRGPFIRGWNGWRLSFMRSGGTLVEKNCHHFDLFNWIAESRPKRVAACGGNDSIYRDGEILDNAWVLVEYENKVRACLGICMFSPYGNELEIGAIGDKGKVETYFERGEIVVWSAERPDKTVYSVTPPAEVKSLGHGGTELNALCAFAKYIAEGKKPLTDGQVGRESVLIATAAEEAIGSGGGIVNI